MTPTCEAESCCCWGWKGNKLRLPWAQQEQDEKARRGADRLPEAGPAPCVHRQPAPSIAAAEQGLECCLRQLKLAQRPAHPFMLYVGSGRLHPVQFGVSAGSTLPCDVDLWQQEHWAGRHAALGAVRRQAAWREFPLDLHCSHAALAQQGCTHGTPAAQEGPGGVLGLQAGLAMPTGSWLRSQSLGKQHGHRGRGSLLLGSVCAPLEAAGPQRASTGW